MENVFIIFEDKDKPGFIKSVGVVGGIVGGLISMLTGLILSIISYFNRTSFHGVEMILLIASVGLLIIGAHSLDLIEKDKKARRIALCKDAGLTVAKRDEYKLANQ